MTNPLDIAWAAGLFDGEGCVYVAKHKPRRGASEQYILAAKVAMTHKPTIERFAQLFGGNILPSQDARANHRPMWVWAIYGRKVHPFLRNILSYAVTKKQEVEIGLEAAQEWKEQPPGRGVRISPELLVIREGYYRALQEAKRAAHD